ncbi:MAG: RDD family protein [Pseudomonadota bacterium]
MQDKTQNQVNTNNQDKPQIKVIANERAPSLIKLGACLIYDALVVVALCFICVLIFRLLAGDATYGIKRHLLQLFLWLSVGAYFVWCWSKSGQTLAMQTWRFKLVNQESSLLSVKMAILRYILATLSLMLFGVGFLWAIVDANRLFLHDRILGSRILQL